MQKRFKSLLLLFMLVNAGASAQQSELVKTYINQYKELAIAEMQRTGVPAAIKLAQGINETLAGTSDLVLRSNNHFGIKCKSTWTGESVKHNDDERGECFRKYPSVEDSYRDHSNFLRGNQRYAFLFDLDPADYAGWAWGLKKAGYATNPRYALALIKTIEEYGLQHYSFIAMGRIPDKTNEITATGGPAAENNGTPGVIPAAAPDSRQSEPAVVPAPAYPKGEFRINETKVIYAPRGSSYLAIAKEYDVDLSKLFEFNELPRADEVDKDRLIYLQRKRKTGEHEFHIVKPGETLHDIAQAEAIRIESLQELNWLKPGEQPAAGEQLSLHRKATTTPRLALQTQYSLQPGSRGTF